MSILLKTRTEYKTCAGFVFWRLYSLAIVIIVLITETIVGSCLINGDPSIVEYIKAVWMHLIIKLNFNFESWSCESIAEMASKLVLFVAIFILAEVSTLGETFCFFFFGMWNVKSSYLHCSHPPHIALLDWMRSSGRTERRKIWVWVLWVKIWIWTLRFERFERMEQIRRRLW